MYVYRQYMLFIGWFIYKAASFPFDVVRYCIPTSKPSSIYKLYQKGSRSRYLRVLQILAKNYNAKNGD